MNRILLKNYLCLILILCLVILVLIEWRRLLAVFMQEDIKDAAMVVANDNDQTMRNVYDEFKKFDTSGYAIQRYPKLEELYASRKSWRLNEISEFSTSIKMQSFGVEKDITEGNWNTFSLLLDDCISGYEQFIPLKQETTAITYLQPALSLSKRIVMSGKILPPDIRQQVVVKLKTLRKLIKAAPTEATNNFKRLFLSDLNEIILKMNEQQEAGET